MDEDLSFEEVTRLLIGLRSIGAKTVEFTGGGDPTMYHAINESIKFSKELGYEIGMISNGVAIHSHITDESLSYLKWLRVSSNALDFVDSLDLNIKDRGFTGTFGFSFVWDKTPNSNTIKKLFDHVEKYDPKYVRVVTNCLATNEEQIENNAKISKVVEGWGKPFFYQPKNFIKHNRCWWCYVKPFILHDGWVYPCSSVVLNSGSEGKFNSQFRWVRIEDLINKYNEDLTPFPTNNCDHCVFYSNNRIMDSVVTYNEMENFV